MVARIVQKDSKYYVLCNDGSMSACNEKEFTSFLKANIQGLTERWDLVYEKMEDYPGKDIAQINDDKSLLIFDTTPFEYLLKESENSMEKQNDISAKEYADKHNKSVEQIKVLCRSGRIEGARKIGRDWLIPENAPYPTRKGVRT